MIVFPEHSSQTCEASCYTPALLRYSSRLFKLKNDGIASNLKTAAQRRAFVAAILQHLRLKGAVESKGGSFRWVEGRAAEAARPDPQAAYLQVGTEHRLVSPTITDFASQP